MQISSRRPRTTARVKYNASRHVVFFYYLELDTYGTSLRRRHVLQL